MATDPNEVHLKDEAPNFPSAPFIRLFDGKSTSKKDDSDSEKTLGQQPPATVSHWQLLSPKGVDTPNVLDSKEYEGSGTEPDPYVISFLDNNPGDPKQLPQ